MSFEINKNLFTLKCVLFLFFGALGCLLPFLPHHMDNVVQLPKPDSTKISIVAPIVALLGPLIAAPLADRLAGGLGGAQRSKTGKYLRVMIAVCLILSTIFYWLLILILPTGSCTPKVTFTCNEEGGYILQDRCGIKRTCYNWNGETGSVLVKNCIFSCNATTGYSKPENSEKDLDEYNTNPNETVYDSDAYDESAPADTEISHGTSDPGNLGIFPYPHMCYTKGEQTFCEVYTEYSKNIDFELTLKPHVPQSSPQDLELSESSDNGTDTLKHEHSSNETEGVCRYSFENSFHCRITNNTKQELLQQGSFCEPVVICEIHDPYNNTNSLLKRSQLEIDYFHHCLYFFLRCVADIFPAAAVTLLATAVVIATRETSTGRGDVGKQLAAGALGFAIFAPIIGGSADGAPLVDLYFNAMICYTVLMGIAVLILIFDNNMPLSPPEWWWHTRCGLLALPMSSVRKYGFEIAALGVVLFSLGVFWNAIDSFLSWHMAELSRDQPSTNVPLIIGFTITVAALPAAILFIFAERVVDYCGHSNILMLCFVDYIIHHVALLTISSAPYLLIFEVLEIFTLHLMWITAILYLRHLVPRRFTACGQALPIVAHFCLGRSLGALFGGWAFEDHPRSFHVVHEGFVAAAAVIAVVYFLSYHFYLKPKCAAPPQLPPYPAPSVVQSMNGNGSYTPLKVYHEGRAKKGHFRY